MRKCRFRRKAREQIFNTYKVKLLRTQIRCHSCRISCMNSPPEVDCTLHYIKSFLQKMVYGTKYINISIGKHALLTTLNKQIKLEPRTIEDLRIKNLDKIYLLRAFITTLNDCGVSVIPTWPSMLGNSSPSGRHTSNSCNKVEKNKYKKKYNILPTPKGKKQSGFFTLPSAFINLSGLNASGSSHKFGSLCTKCCKGMI
ncbi:hypothetical protein AGLY_000275 [Aphis glycines]|uniref:Uncharacterized protein n=1 Tax=Aphis glycines TaxID=307491 RepID=A0A6G0U712_APHGL|nr:hypothetical protein AGLY_000275 [Aphis glycines]